MLTVVANDTLSIPAQVCRAATEAAKNAATRGMADAEVDAGINSIEELWDRDGWVLDLLLDMGKELRSVPMIGVCVCVCAFV